jgi:hypothetical protein
MKVILYDKVSRTNGRCDFGILKSLSNKFDDAAFSVVRDTATVQVLLSAKKDQYFDLAKNARSWHQSDREGRTSAR